MNKILALFLSLFGISAFGDNQNANLVEFSTSMDFEEFNVVLKHLSAKNSAFASELTEIIEKFKKSSQPGGAQQRNIKGGLGLITLEREDEYAFGIAAFTVEELNKQLNNAYESAINELNI
jgi:hypothetical protein